MDLRLLTVDDAEAFWHLRLQALRNDSAAFADSTEEHLETTVETSRERLSAGDSARNFVVGAFEDGKLIGTAGFFRRPNKKERHKGHIWGVYVRLELRGKGVGSALMHEIMSVVLVTRMVWSKSRSWLPPTFLHNACTKLWDLKATESSRTR